MGLPARKEPAQGGGIEEAARTVLDRRNVTIERAARRMERLRQAAPHSLSAHAFLVHRTSDDDRLRAARHHRVWTKLLEDRETFPGIVVVAPPGYAKTTWFSQVYPTWEIARTQGRVRVGLISGTATQAHALSREVQERVLSPEFRSVYPDPGLLPNYRRKWTQSEWALINCPPGNTMTLTAAGIGGPIQGKRFDLIILDDPTSWEDARSEEIMDRQRRWLKGLLVKRFPAGTGPPTWKDRKSRMVVVLTRWSDRDLVPTLEELGFQIVTMPALGYWDQVTVPETGEVIFGEEPLWPEIEPLEQLLEERHDDELIFELVKQGNPRVLAGEYFDLSEIKRDEPPEREDFDGVFAYADTSSGKERKRGDFFALVTIGFKGKEFWVLDIQRKRIPAPHQEQAIRDAFATFAHDLIVIEDANEGTAIYQHLVGEGLPLKLRSPIGDKEFRAIPLRNAYAAGYGHHPPGRPWVKPYEAELEGFPEVAHDDQVDAAAGAYAEGSRSGPRLRVLG